MVGVAGIYNRKTILHLEFPFWVKEVFDLWLLKGGDLDITKMRIFAEDMSNIGGAFRSLQACSDGTSRLVVSECFRDISATTPVNTFKYFHKPTQGFYGEWNIGTATPADCLSPG